MSEPISIDMTEYAAGVRDGIEVGIQAATCTVEAILLGQVGQVQRACYSHVIDKLRLLGSENREKNA